MMRQAISAILILDITVHIAVMNKLNQGNSSIVIFYSFKVSRQIACLIANFVTNSVFKNRKISEEALWNPHLNSVT
jgi:hypothetical protein